jgi:hypothetical protein
MSILLLDGQNQRFHGALASILAIFLGGFILLPYFGLRRTEKGKTLRLNVFIRLFESKLTSVTLMLVSAGLITSALILGDRRAFVDEFLTNRFIHIMTIDFFVVSFLFPFLVEDDLRRRATSTSDDRVQSVALCFVPLIGPLIYLYRRRALTPMFDTKTRDQ